MDDIKKMFLENKAWAYEKKLQNPDYFNEMAKDQSPKFLWIGCADSRVPPDVITGTNPGEMFVQRNVANLVVHTDLNLMSVVEYAINVLKVKHVIVCGHYGCGGVRAAMSNISLGTINKWIRNIKDTYQLHFKELDKIEIFESRFQRLVELNAVEQVKNLTHSSLVQKAWDINQELFLHAWVYDLNTGMLKDLLTVDKDYPIEEIYKYKFR